LPQKSKGAVRLHTLSLAERQNEIQKIAGLTQAEIIALSGAAGLTPEQADHMVENAVGTFNLPLGIAPNFLVN